jgi:hypothetical protein
MVERHRVSLGVAGGEQQELFQRDGLIVGFGVDHGRLTGHLFLVTDLAGGIDIPLLVTAHAVAMIGPLQSGLSKILVDDRRGMAIDAGRVLLVGGCEVVTDLAAPGELHHLGVSLVVEVDRGVEVLQLVQDHRGRTEARLQVLHGLVPGANRLQAGVRLGGVFAGVAVGAIQELLLIRLSGRQGEARHGQEQEGADYRQGNEQLPTTRSHHSTRLAHRPLPARNLRIEESPWSALA